MATSAVPDSFNQAEQLKSFVSGTAIQPLETTAGTLNSIKLIADLKSNRDKLGDDLGKIVDEELNYLHRGIKAVSENPILAAKFGKDFNAAMTVSGLIKRMHSDLAYEQILKPYAFNRDDEREIQRRASAFSS